MRSAKLVLLAGLLLTAVAIVLTLLQSPISVVGTNGVADSQTSIGSTPHNATFCQSGERLPRGTSAIRVSLFAAAGPRVSVDVYARGRRLAGGTRGSIWIGDSVTIPVESLPRTIAGATVCVSFRVRDETIIAMGATTAASVVARDGAHRLGGRMRIEYLRAGTRSWASLAPEIARHMGLGRAAGGTWIVFLAVALLVAAAVLASRLVLRELP
jgi:hypothetical protein